MTMAMLMKGIHSAFKAGSNGLPLVHALYMKTDKEIVRRFEALPTVLPELNYSCFSIPLKAMESQVTPSFC